MIYGLYRTLSHLGGPIIRAYLDKRRLAGKEDPVRFGERLGNPGARRPEGPLVWLHGASLGESISLLPLVNELNKRAGLTLLMTTGSVTSATLMAKRLPDEVIHQYIPVDRMAYVKPFLDHWRPDLAIWCESEFWPNLICESSRRGTSLVLVNGRVSAKSYRGWQKARSLIARVLGCFDLCIGQTQEDADRLSRLGATRTTCHGNLKYAAPPLPFEAEELTALKNLYQDRPVWFAASTHAGEELMAGRIHCELKKQYPSLLTIIAPRHPDRGANIAAELRSDGLKVAARSQGHPLQTDTDIYLADTMGELGLFFRLADLTFMGKSITARGGQNPLEPALLGCAILNGPHQENFVEISQEFDAAKAMHTVNDEAELRQTLAHLFDNPEAAKTLGTNALKLAEQKAGVLGAVMEELAPYLDRLSSSRQDHARP